MNITKEDYDNIFKVVERAEKLGLEFNDRFTLHLDLVNAHKEFNLDLKMLNNIDDENFAHDICGIQRNIDRDTGKMGNCFVPRVCKTESKPLMKLLLEAGIKKEDLNHHESDLYVPVTPTSKKVVEDWCKENGYTIEHHCPTFKDHISGKLSYDCAFQYVSHLDEKQTKTERTETPLKKKSRNER